MFNRERCRQFALILFFYFGHPNQKSDRRDLATHLIFTRGTED